MLRRDLHFWVQRPWPWWFPFCIAVWFLWGLTVETIPVSSITDMDQAVFRNPIKFQKYNFQITCSAGNRLDIRTRADLAVTGAPGSNCYFMLADIYRTKINKLAINGNSVVFRHWNDIYSFRLPWQLRGQKKIRLELDYEIISKYTGNQVSAELSGAWYPKNLFPERVLAAFDLRVPPGMIGIANGELEAVQNEPGSVRSDLVRYRWRTGDAQPNLALSIGRYNSFVRLIHYRTYRIYAPQSLEADSRQLSLWASLIGEQYQARFGGSDYHGLTLVINDTALEDTSFGALIFLHPGRNQPVNRKFFKLAHEIAHFWWGNLVIPRTPQDWWLAEGFANYSAFLICEQLSQQKLIDERLSYETLHYEPCSPEQAKTFPVDKPAAILGDWQKQYRDFLENLRSYQIPEMSIAEIGPFDFQRELLYNKGAFVLHMTRLLLGDDGFFRYVRRFVAEYQMKQVGIRDFTRMGSVIYGAELADFFRQWVYSAGIYDAAIQNVKITPLFGQAVPRAGEKYRISFNIINQGQLYLPNMVDLEISTGKQIHHDVLYFKGVNVTIQKTSGELPQKIKLNGDYRILETDMGNDVWIAPAKG